jgi:caspase 7
MAMGNYKMNHKKRGVALVINIRSYDAPNPFELKERVWSVKDVENLKKTLNYLEFQVILCNNIAKSELEQVMREQSLVNYKNSDCFLCVVMSHGNKEKIVTSDNQEISFEDIMAPIKSCVSLENKPKLFFFQACRGENEVEITRVKSRPDSGASTSRIYR